MNYLFKLTFSLLIIFFLFFIVNVEKNMKSNHMNKIVKVHSQKLQIDNIGLN